MQFIFQHAPNRALAFLNAPLYRDRYRLVKMVRFLFFRELRLLCITLFLFIFFVNEDYYVLVSEQFSADSKSRHVINKKISMKVFFPQLVSDQRLEGCQIAEKENCSKPSTLRVHFVRCTGFKSSYPSQPIVGLKLKKFFMTFYDS